MSLARPSFYRLFRRSCYVCGPNNADAAEAAVKREERERFAVASLAFCLKHSEPFRRHFWTTICRSKDDQETMPPLGADSIELEPRRWSDLRIVHEEGNRRFVWVVEAKAGARLDPRQDPSKSAFRKDGGYGKLLVKAENGRETRLRYVILGHDRSIKMPETVMGILVQERTWAHLHNGFSATGIIEDLFSCFGDLHINPFYMEKAKRITLRSGISGVAEAWTVLHAVCESLGISSSSRDFQVETDDNGSTWVGIYVKKPRKGEGATFHHRLKTATGSKGYLGWLGYWSKRDDNQYLIRDAGFYCDATREKVILGRLRKAFPRAETGCNEGDHSVYVSSPPNGSMNDFSWFTAAFQTAIGTK